MVVAFLIVWFLASGILLKEDDMKCTVIPAEHLITHSLFHIQPARIVLLTIT